MPFAQLHLVKRGDGISHRTSYPTSRRGDRFVPMSPSIPLVVMEVMAKARTDFPC